MGCNVGDTLASLCPVRQQVGDRQTDGPPSEGLLTRRQQRGGGQQPLSARFPEGARGSLPQLNPFSLQLRTPTEVPALGWAGGAGTAPWGRMMGSQHFTGWFGLEGTLQTTSFHPPALGGTPSTNQPMLLQAPSNLALNPARQGAATASLGNLAQGLTTSSESPWLSFGATTNPRGLRSHHMGYFTAPTLFPAS